MQRGITTIAIVILLALVAGGVAYIAVEQPFNAEPDTDFVVNIDNETPSPTPEEPNPTPGPTPTPTPTPNPTPAPTVSSGECFMLDQTEYSGDGFELIVGGSLAPSGVCESVVIDNTTGAVVDFRNLTEEQRENATGYNCLEGGVISGCQVPDVSYSYNYADFNGGNNALKLRDEILADVFGQIFARRNSPYTLTEIEQLGAQLADWADSFNRMILLDGEYLLTQGGNAGGHSPVIMPSIKQPVWNGEILSTVYDLYARWDDALQSSTCATNFFENYITTTTGSSYESTDAIPPSLIEISASPSSLEQFASDVSCLGVITFEETVWGSH